MRIPWKLEWTGFFNKITNIVKTPVPVAGETWVLKREEQNPFVPSSKIKVEVKILEVRNGWVNYFLNPIFNSEAKSLESFTAIYMKKEENVEVTNQ